MAEKIRFDSFIQYGHCILDMIVTDESQLFAIGLEGDNISIIHLNSDFRHIYLEKFRPWRLALVQILDYKEMAVTTRTNTIIIVDYRRNRYTPREIHTDKKYIAVAQGPERDKLVVSCAGQQNACIDVIQLCTRDNNIYGSVHISIPMYGLNECVYLLAVCDKVFVSCNLPDSVIRININSPMEIPFVYKHKRLNFPRRCATDQFDNLYIPCTVIDPCILKMSSEGDLLVIYELSSKVTELRGDILFPSIFYTGNELLVFWSFIFLRSHPHARGQVNMAATYWNRIEPLYEPLFSQEEINPFKMYIPIPRLS